jgi:TolB-like protein
MYWKTEMIAVLIKDNKLASYPADLLIEGEVVKFNEIFNKNVTVLVGKGLSSDLIEKLRKKGIVFLKVNSLEEIEGLDLNIDFKEEKLKRGVGCQSKFKGG